MDTVLDALRKGADAGASFCVIGESDRTLSDILDEAEARARGLVAAGLRPRERVGLALPNGTDALVWIYAVIAAGGSAVLIPPYAKAAEVAGYATRAATRWVIGSIADADCLSSADAIARFSGGDGVALPEPGLDWEAGCFTTSGSTGMPKLAALTHGGWAANTAVLDSVTGGGLAGTSFYCLPMCHVAVLPNVHSFLTSGGRVVHLPVFDAQHAVSVAAEHRATYMSGSPAIYGLMLQRAQLPDPGLAFDRVSYGAGAMPAHWAADLGAALGCDVMHGYGLTEGGGFVTIQPPAEHLVKPGSAGKAQPPFEPLRIVDPESGRECGTDEVGEILVKGPSCMVGYVGDAAATAETITDDGWVRTGDLGRLDADGDLWVTGRLKDQINRGGLKIGAREIEIVIEGLDGVTGVGVVGTPCPVLEQRVAAVVEAPPGAIDAERIRAACIAVLADHKVPERIEIMEAMPRTSLGKPDKPAMRRLLT